MTRNIDLEHARKVALEASEKASTLLRSRFGSDMNIELKGPADFVTELDGQCEEIIKEVLAHFDDSIAFVGEESYDFGYDNNKVTIDIDDTCWIVDPLDGTSNFTHSFGAFCVSIALRVDKELVCGVIQAPVTGDLVHATRNQGAYRVMFDRSEIPLAVKDAGDGFNLLSSSVPFRKPEFIPQHMRLLERLYPQFEDLRRVGSAALDLSWVASGTFSSYVEMFLKPWDCAAGGLCVCEAGGVVSDYSGHEHNWLTNGQVVASASPRVQEMVLNLIE